MKIDYSKITTPEQELTALKAKLIDTNQQIRTLERRDWTRQHGLTRLRCDRITLRMDIDNLRALIAFRQQGVAI